MDLLQGRKPGEAFVGCSVDRSFLLLYYLDILSLFFLPEIQLSWKPLKTRANCDLILPDDWFYMPLLEAYFLICRHDNTKEAGSASQASKVDSEVIIN